MFCVYLICNNFVNKKYKAALYSRERKAHNFNSNQGFSIFLPKMHRSKFNIIFFNLVKKIGYF